MAGVDRFSFVINEVSYLIGRYRNVLAVIGLCWTGKVLLSFTYNLYSGFRTHLWSKYFFKDLTYFGEWAVITGGSEGIGRGYALALAARGINLVIISRDLRKLKLVQNEIKAQFKVKVEIISADFNDFPKVMDYLEEKLRNKKIGILVNNACYIPQKPNLFFENSKKYLLGTINVNIASYLMMTHLLLGNMVSRKKGLIINVSSLTAYHPLPYILAYSTSKAFDDWFSQALDYEYRDKGIIVQSIMPSYIANMETKFNRILQKPKILFPSTETFAFNALKTVGYSNRTTGYWSHGLQFWLISHIPYYLYNLITWNVLRSFTSRSI